MGNDIKFTSSKASRKGHVALSTRLLALDDQSVTLEFCVMDTGIGIAKDKLDLIFDTCQANGSTTRVNYSYSISLVFASEPFRCEQEYGGTVLASLSRSGSPTLCKQHVGRK